MSGRAQHIGRHTEDESGRSGCEEVFPYRLYGYFRECYSQHNTKCDGTGSASIGRHQKVVAAGLAQIGHSNGDDQERFDRFAQGDDKNL